MATLSGKDYYVNPNYNGIEKQGNLASDSGAIASPQNQILFVTVCAANTF